MRGSAVRPSLTATALLALALTLSGCVSSGTEAAPGPAAGSAPPAHAATPATSQVRAERPLSLTLPSGRVLPVEPAGTRSDGSLAVPDHVHRAGWWEGSSRLGDPFGSIVVAAHVDSFTDGVGPAAELVSAQTGDLVRMAGRHLAQQYRIVSVRSVPRAELRHLSVVFSAAGDPRLVPSPAGAPTTPPAAATRTTLSSSPAPRGR